MYTIFAYLRTYLLTYLLTDLAGAAHSTCGLNVLVAGKTV